MPLGIGVVGCGDIALYMALVSRTVRSVRLAACCDTDRDRAVAFASRHGIPRFFTDYGSLLEAQGVDAVYLAVPHDLHAPMIRSAVEAGKPVLVEKPIARTLVEAIQVAGLSRVFGVKVGVNYQYRYDRGCYALAQAARAGELGRIHSVRINVPWRREVAYFDKSPWHGTVARAGGGTLLTQGSHFLDVALWALDRKPVSAVGYTGRPGFDVEVESVAHGVVQTSGGALIQIASSMVAAPEGAVTIEVYGDRATGTYRNRPWPHTRFSGVRPRRRRPPTRGVHALARCLEGFVRWVTDDTPFLVPAAQALPVLAAVEAIYRSAATGARAVVDDLGGLGGSV